MTTAARMLAEAASHVGYREQRRNRNMFSAGLGRPPEPWCADFLVWCARRVGLRLPNESAGTVVLLQGFRNAGRASHTPTVGAFAFFNFPDRVRRVQHVGIVESWTAATVTCVEGNTAGTRWGSQSNGGGVYRKTRPRAHVAAYGHPAYDNTPGPSAGPFPSGDDDMTPEQAQQLDQVHRAVARLETMLAGIAPLVPESNERGKRLGLALGAIKRKLGITDQ